jgi:hypothetical protein
VTGTVVEEKVVAKLGDSVVDAAGDRRLSFTA